MWKHKEWNTRNYQPCGMKWAIIIENVRQENRLK